MTSFAWINSYEDREFPDDWDEDDFEFLAEFLDTECGLKLYRELADEDYPIVLLREEA